MPDRREHPSAYACRLYNDRLARSGSPLRWVTTAGGGHNDPAAWSAKLTISGAVTHA